MKQKSYALYGISSIIKREVDSRVNVNGRLVTLYRNNGYHRDAIQKKFVNDRQKIDCLKNHNRYQPENKVFENQAAANSSAPPQIIRRQIENKTMRTLP